MSGERNTSEGDQSWVNNYARQPVWNEILNMKSYRSDFSNMGDLYVNMKIKTLFLQYSHIMIINMIIQRYDDILSTIVLFILKKINNFISLYFR
jgi:hypothetical protein